MTIAARLYTGIMTVISSLPIFFRFVVRRVCQFTDPLGGECLERPGIHICQGADQRCASTPAYAPCVCRYSCPEGMRMVQRYQGAVCAKYAGV